MKMRRARCDSKLAHLPEHQQKQLADWFLSGISYKNIMELVKNDFGIHTNAKALTRFWQDFCAPLLWAKREKAAIVAREFMAAADGNPAPMEEASLEAIRQKLFEMALTPDVDCEALKSLAMVILRAKQLNVASRAVTVQERRIAQAEEAEKVARVSELTDAERSARLREIFGLAS